MKKLNVIIVIIYFIKNGIILIFSVNINNNNFICENCQYFLFYYRNNKPILLSSEYGINDITLNYIIEVYY